MVVALRVVARTTLEDADRFRAASKARMPKEYVVLGDRPVTTWRSVVPETVATRVQAA